MRCFIANKYSALGNEVVNKHIERFTSTNVLIIRSMVLPRKVFVYEKSETFNMTGSVYFDAIIQKPR